MPIPSGLSRYARGIKVCLIVLLAAGVGAAALSVGSSPRAPTAQRPSHLALTSLPLAAQSAISATLGAHDARYRPIPARSGPVLSAPGERLQAHVGSRGVHIDSAALQLGLTLRAVGYGGSLLPLRASAPRITAGRIVYRYRGLTEWFASGPLGLEQGFTVARPSARRVSGSLTLAITVTGNVHESLSRSGRELAIDGPHGSALHYGALIARDAHGHVLPSSLAFHEGQILLRVNTRHARFPVRIDPLIQQRAKLVADDESGTGRLGADAALSADGNTALVGGLGDNTNVGAAWVFVRSGSTWSQQGPKLTASDEVATGSFGVSVALSADGNTALIGGYNDDLGSGAAWVFTRTGSTWTQQGPKLTPSDSTGPLPVFGITVALSGDGHTALIGAPQDNAHVGAAWVFTRSADAWTQQGPKLTADDASENARFGTRVALSEDGDTALIGGDGDTSENGAAWIFTRSGATWSQQGPKLTPADNTGPAVFGWDVGLSADGNTAIVSGINDNRYQGAVWVFTRTGSTWAQQGSKLTADDEPEDGSFGLSVALAADGNTALIGGYDNSRLGWTWAFTRSDETWTQQGPKIYAGDESGGGEFGEAVALSANGHTALIGGPGDDALKGAAWIFFLPEGSPPTVKKLSPRTGPSAGGTSVTITGIGLTGATAVRFGSTYATSFSVTSASSISAVAPPSSSGRVDVTVIAPGGVSAISTRDAFTYGTPTVIGVSPDSGPTEAGTKVTVTGTGFAPGAGMTAFKFGRSSATNVECASTTTCTMQAPAAKKQATVDVVATVAKAKSKKNPPADQYRYE